MKTKLVRDVMLLLEHVPTVHKDTTLLKAVNVLQEAQKSRPKGYHSYRAVLVLNDQKEVVGKLDHRAFLGAIEPGFDQSGDIKALNRAGFSKDMIATISDNQRFWQDDILYSCLHAGYVPVERIMLPVNNSIDANLSLLDGIHALLKLDTLSILVKEDKKIVGLLRQADIFREVAGLISEICPDEQLSED